MFEGASNDVNVFIFINAIVCQPRFMCFNIFRQFVQLFIKDL